VADIILMEGGSGWYRYVGTREWMMCIRVLHVYIGISSCGGMRKRLEGVQCIHGDIALWME
jgi:hypothetical protein